MKIENLPKNPCGNALTLWPSYIGKHEDGWEIIGDTCRDYYEWVSKFVAYKHTDSLNGFHAEWVAGDFEEEIYASSQEAYDEFVKLYPPEQWNYGDI